MTSSYTQRILHSEERQFLSPEAQELAYHYFLTQEVPSEVTEKAIMQAQAMKYLGVNIVSGEMFQEILNANAYDEISQVSPITGHDTTIQVC